MSRNAESVEAGRTSSRLLADARRLARGFLSADPQRLRHTEGVAERATGLTGHLTEADSQLVIAAAWLHDIGYAAGVRATGFHPLDGARFLRRLDWHPQICSLVAHHSGSRFLAELPGFGPELAEFWFEEEPMSDVLTVADQTVGPSGERVDIDERLAEALARHGPNSPWAQADARRAPYIRGAALRVAEQRLLWNAGRV